MGQCMIDIMVLKAASDAASVERIAAARELAYDPDAPRRALRGMPGDRAASPSDYLDTILTLPPVALSASKEDWTGWQRARERRLKERVEIDLGPLLARGVPGADPEEGIQQIDAEDRVAGYDAMAPEDRDAWVEAFRQIANDWLDAAAADFGGADDLPRACGWTYEAIAYPTVDGGGLLICAADDNRNYDGVASWFEAALFVLAEVAKVAGFHEPSTFDVG
jgi:hypothetical protein